MAKGGRKNQAKSRQNREESEESEEVQQVEDSEPQQEEDDEDQIDYLNQQISDRDEELLQRINEQILATEEPLKLTWAAIYRLKEEQKQINQKMDEEMRKIQDKYHELRIPIIERIAKAASGQVLEKELYTSHELTKSISVNKHKPRGIPDFWKKSFDSVGLIDKQLQLKILESCTNFECKHILEGEGENQKSTYKAQFTFRDNEIIKNKDLKLSVSKKGEQFTKITQSKLEFKGEALDEHSSLAEMFSESTNGQALYVICQNLQRMYENAVFYYFYQPELSGDQNENENEKENSDQEEQEEEQSQSEIKATKKKPSKGNKVEEVKKPECTNQ